MGKVASPPSKPLQSNLCNLTSNSPDFRRIHVRRLLIVGVNGPIFFRIERPVFAVQLLRGHGEYETIVIRTLTMRTKAGLVVPPVRGVRHPLRERSRPRQRLQGILIFAVAFL